MLINKLYKVAILKHILFGVDAMKFTAVTHDTRRLVPGALLSFISLSLAIVCMRRFAKKDRHTD